MNWLLQKTCVAQSVGNPAGICIANYLQIISILIITGVLVLLVTILYSIETNKHKGKKVSN